LAGGPQCLSRAKELKKEDIQAALRYARASLDHTRLRRSVPEILKRYLDQMFALDVAEALCGEGYDIVRASEIGQARADDEQILQKAISENRILLTLDEHFGDW